MKKLLIVLISIITVLMISIYMYLPVSNEQSLAYEFKLLQSEYLDDICEYLDVDLIQLVQNEFMKYDIELTREESELLINKLLEFEYDIQRIDENNVRVTIKTVDLFALSKAEIKENLKDIVVALLSGKDLKHDVIVKNVIESLPQASKDYEEVIDVEMDLYSNVFYVVDLEKNPDLLNALSGGILYKLQMIDQVINEEINLYKR